MKLVLTKKEIEGPKGKTRFEVMTVIQLSDTEKELAERYEIDKMALFSRKVMNIWGQPADAGLNVTVKEMLDGESYECDDLSEVISLSDSLKSGCETLKAYLEVARGFEGDGIVEISY